MMGNDRDLFCCRPNRKAASKAKKPARFFFRNRITSLGKGMQCHVVEFWKLHTGPFDSVVLSALAVLAIRQKGSGQ